MSAFLPSLVVSSGAAAIVMAMVSAPAATAIPECTNTGPTTTQCERPGNVQINTSPSVTTYNYPFGWPWWNGGGITISLGGLGIG